MVDTLSGPFLCILAHSILLFVIYFQQEPHLLAGLPQHVNEISSEARIEFVVLIAISILGNIVELGFLIRRLPSSANSLISMILHFSACLFLLKFIVDEHPVTHFWILFALTTSPILISNVIDVALNFKIR